MREFKMFGPAGEKTLTVPVTAARTVAPRK